jgi:hypothetical protein
VNIDTKEAILTNMKADMIINERHNAKKPVPPPRKKRQFKRNSSVPSGGEVQDAFEKMLPECICLHNPLNCMASYPVTFCAFSLCVSLL